VVVGYFSTLFTLLLGDGGNRSGTVAWSEVPRVLFFLIWPKRSITKPDPTRFIRH